MISIFLTSAGFIIGLGAVTVIDWHGFLGRKSSYWTVATTRTHKITKPLIWLGTVLFLIGGNILYLNEPLFGLRGVYLLSLIILILNGLFLTFSVSPFLLAREKVSQDTELLPKSWQAKIFVSFVISFTLWWGQVLMFAYFLSIAR